MYLSTKTLLPFAIVARSTNDFLIYLYSNHANITNLSCVGDAGFVLQQMTMNHMHYGYDLVGAEEQPNGFIRLVFSAG